MTIMFDYSRKADVSEPNVHARQTYHARLFTGNSANKEMESFFSELYDKYGDFHIIDMVVLYGFRVLLVYSVPAPC